MRSLKLHINVGFRETEEPVTAGDGIERLADGSFQLILSHEVEFNIDYLENALLKTTYPALRTALSEHLEQSSKKKPVNYVKN